MRTAAAMLALLLAAAPAAAQANPRFELSVQASHYGAAPSLSGSGAGVGGTLRAAYRPERAPAGVEAFYSFAPREGDGPRLDALGIGLTRAVAGARTGGSALFVSGGIGAVRVGEPRSYPAPGCGSGPECLNPPGTGEVFGQMRPALHLGFGGRAALLAHLGVRADVRVHAWSADGADEEDRVRPPRFEVALGIAGGF